MVYKLLLHFFPFFYLLIINTQNYQINHYIN